MKELMIDRDWGKELEPILREAGDILLSFYGRDLQIKEKPHNGFVTSADLASEKYLIQALGQLLPEASFFAEESGASGNSDYCWVIDPLDGTTNFAHGIPYWCISVALTHKNVPIFGAIYVPLQDDYFFAAKGKGAWCNGVAIHVSEPEKLSQALIAIGIPYSNEQRPPIVHLGERIAFEAYGIRHLGAIALDLANISCGRLDGVVLTGLAWWDVAAGIVLLEQAGGKIADFEGNPLTPGYKTGVAGGNLVFNSLKTIIKTKNTH